MTVERREADLTEPEAWLAPEDHPVIWWECDDCHTTAEALASGFDPGKHGEWADFAEPCVTPGCRWYEPIDGGEHDA